MIHLVKFHELAEKEEILVAKDSPVGGEETQADILLATDLLIALQEHLGLVTAAVCRRHSYSIDGSRALTRGLTALVTQEGDRSQIQRFSGPRL